MVWKVKPRKISNGFFCTLCGNHHCSFGVIGKKHIKYKLEG